jgi:hypothetical protein
VAIYDPLVQRIIKHISILRPSFQPGGLGVGSSNLPAPTNKINNLLLDCVTQKMHCVTYA